MLGCKEYKEDINQDSLEWKNIENQERKNWKATRKNTIESHAKQNGIENKTTIKYIVVI